MEIRSIFCPNCGANIPEQIKRGKIFRCNNCGGTLVWPEFQPTLVLNFGARLCPECGVDNEQIRDFCRNCGTQLIKVCPLCKTKFYIGDNFCPNGHDYDQHRLEMTTSATKKRVDLKAQKNILMYLQEAGNIAQLGNLEQAANVLEEALDINPEWAPKIAGFPYSENSVIPATGYGLLIHLAGKSKNRELAIQYFTRMLDLNPNERQNALRAAYKAGIERESQKIAKQRGLKWQWWL
jgi:tetratricopeptide (TPR) repeat protein